MSQETIVVRIDIRLSQDELAFLLRALGIAQIPGFTPSKTISEEAAGIVARTLLARGFIQLGEDGVLVDQGVAAAVGGGAITERATLLIVHHPTDETLDNPHWFYLIPNFTLYHSRPTLGVHRFKTEANGLEVAVDVASILDVPLDNVIPAPQGQEVTISRQVYVQGRELAHKGQIQQARQFLSQHGVKGSGLQALTQPQARYTVAQIQANGGQVAAAGMLILRVEDGYWIANVAPDSTTVTPVDSQRLLNTIATLMGTEVR
ncbi:MAG: hypothetical protein NZ750_05965 [Anaerolineae bacterium]|nr:hypothetical protein [Anaerolineae bacterium]MDW8172993.1 hypothetical protein [Anaerolineae bacterium]